MKPSIATTIRDLLLEAEAHGRREGGGVRCICPICSAGQRRKPSLWISPGRVAYCHKTDCPVGRGGIYIGDAGERERDRQAELDHDQRRREFALRLIERSRPIEDGDPADLYLRGRRLRPRGEYWPRDLRSVTAKHPSGKYWPCMLATVRDPDARVIACHRTYLTHDGQKADVEPCKMSLGPVRGGAVRLGPDATSIVVAEGIESALAAGLLVGDVPWATLSAGGMSALQLPKTIESITIVCDHDDAGITACKRLLKRCKRWGIKAHPRMPERPGADANDEIQC